MATVNYVVKENDAEVLSIFRQVVDADGTTVLSEMEADMAEVRNVDGSALDSYFEAVADKLDETVVALRDADDRPSEDTYIKCGKAYMTLQLLVSKFDRSVLPPSNTL